MLLSVVDDRSYARSFAAANHNIGGMMLPVVGARPPHQHYAVATSEVCCCLSSVSVVYARSFAAANHSIGGMLLSVVGVRPFNMLIAS